MPTEFRLERVGDAAVVRIVPERESAPGMFGEAALRSLDRVLDDLSRVEYAAALFVGASRSFSSGADIDEFTGITPQRAREGSRAGHELFGRIRALPQPTVAAIGGTCLGGGLELALHCSARTAAASVRAIAFPEVFLGLVPGWGGTQLLPRLAGADAAVRVIVENPLRGNRMLTAPRALSLGIVDAVLGDESFFDESLAFALALAADARPSRTPPDWSDAETVLRRGRTSADDAVHGATPAPYVALELIEGAQTWNLEEGLRREEDAIAELLPGRQAQASLYAFDLVERRAKRQPRRPSAHARRVEKVGIAGAGLMARQIALLLLRRLERPVVIRDIDGAQVDQALAEISGELRRLSSRGRHDARDVERLGALVSGTTDDSAFAGCDVVVEAVFEELDVKRRVFGELEAIVGATCTLATNTSSLSVTEMGAGLRHPERLVGMHFFNPVAVMPLVEIVRARETDDVTVATAFELVATLRKRAVLVADAPGFVVNRVLTRMTRVIMDAVEHGTPLPEVDEAVMSLGMPMAPSVLLAMVGPRVANHVLETLHAAWPERFALSPTLANYAGGKDDVVLVADAPWSREQVVERVLEAVADEVHRILEERVVPEAADVDTCLLLGAGWPFFLGGITKHLDQTGLSHRLFGDSFAAMGRTRARS